MAWLRANWFQVAVIVLLVTIYAEARDANETANEARRNGALAIQASNEARSAALEAASNAEEAKTAAESADSNAQEAASNADDALTAARNCGR